MIIKVLDVPQVLVPNQNTGKFIQCIIFIDENCIFQGGNLWVLVVLAINDLLLAR